MGTSVRFMIFLLQSWRELRLRAIRLTVRSFGLASLRRLFFYFGDASFDYAATRRQG